MFPLIDIGDDARSSVQLSLAARVTLRATNEADSRWVEQWFELSDVELSWGSAVRNLEFFRRPPPSAEQRMIAVDGIDVGYIRWQSVSRRSTVASLVPLLNDGGVQIDVLVGPRERRFVGLGSVALRRVRENLDETNAQCCCFGLTSVHHLAARRAYEKAGFLRHYFYEDPSLGPAVAMVCSAPTTTSA